MLIAVRRLQSRAVVISARHLCSAPNGKEHYVGPLKATLRRVKILSLSTLSVSTVGTPILAMADVPSPPAVRIVLGLASLLFSLGTTAALHFVSRTYVSQMWISPERTATIERFDLFARAHHTKVKLSDLVLTPGAAFSTFRDKKSGDFFYIHDNDLPDYFKKLIEKR